MTVTTLDSIVTPLAATAAFSGECMQCPRLSLPVSLRWGGKPRLCAMQGRRAPLQRRADRRVGFARKSAKPDKASETRKSCRRFVSIFSSPCCRRRLSASTHQLQLQLQPTRCLCSGPMCVCIRGQRLDLAEFFTFAPPPPPSRPPFYVLFLCLRAFWWVSMASRGPWGCWLSCGG